MKECCSLMMTSNGFEGFSEATVYVAGASMTAQGEGDRRPNGYHYIVIMAQEDLPSPEEIGPRPLKEHFPCWEPRN